MRSVVVSNVMKAYAGHPVLKGVDLAVGEGRIAALLGPSGCGKTTLLRLIAGFDRVDDGLISIDGAVVSGEGRHEPAERRRVGYVPQEGALFPHLTVAGNVGFGLARRDRTPARIAEALALVGCAALGDRYPHQLSGGQQQRVALARALAPRPRLVVLDEPFNGLDLDLRRAVAADVTATLRRTRASAILVTHDPEEAFASADLVAVMHAGRIAQAADPRTVYLTPASPEVARITGAAIFLDATVSAGRATTPLGMADLGAVAEGVNGRASLCLRPEQIVLARPDGGRAAKVVDMSFRGDHSLLTVVVDDRRLNVRAPAAFEADASGLVHLAIAGPCVAFLPS
ncbi:iron(III) transport system ATP-binding protein [Methylopila capsulata]|uniref:ABC transporter n=1 Tax=Methylopila capsulata TaxID=61654 RepID=A0A9W6MSX0_9HYPH|nr:ABC transporter ATP-binding protein [Methylopila capsulata]MBM7853580.1 iron(III) transport system ATP-binding protein [Methylopila capsulata]GLK57205.1 ABC transporter [Methylopila capsulata]